MKEQKDGKMVVWGLIGTLVIIGLWITTYFILKDSGLEERGTFGDMFGSINALFSGLALAGIIFTILLQRRELGYQRDELKATREEFKIQNETLRLQRFENTFFNLLSLHHQIVDSIDLDSQVLKKSGSITVSLVKADYDSIKIQGRDVFKEKYIELKQQLVKVGIKHLNDRYIKFYEDVQTDFGHYFRNLYRIIKFIDETEFYSKNDLGIDKDNMKEEDLLKHDSSNRIARYKYTSMVRAQLSDYELLWICYNCLSQNGIEKFKPLLERYTLLKNMPKDKVHTKLVLKEYEESAFEKL